jgi:hypothetical protein
MRRAIAKAAPAIFSEKVDMKRVRTWAIQEWVGLQLRAILGMEDEIVERMVLSLLESDPPDPVEVQAQLTPFLEKDTASFVQELWAVLLSAQAEPTGVPRALLEARQGTTKARVAAVESAASRLRSDLGSTFVRGGTEGGSTTRPPAPLARSEPTAPPSVDVSEALARAKALIEQHNPTPAPRTSRWGAESEARAPTGPAAPAEDLPRRAPSAPVPPPPPAALPVPTPAPLPASADAGPEEDLFDAERRVAALRRERERERTFRVDETRHVP